MTCSGVLAGSIPATALSPIPVGYRERKERVMRYLVHRGTGTILGVNDDLVIVDVDDIVDLDESDILELADNVPAWNKAIIGNAYDLPIDISDQGIADELTVYVANWSYVNVEIGETDSYGYCLANPDTWPLIRGIVLDDVALWSEYSDTFANAVITVANEHSAMNGVAE